MMKLLYITPHLSTGGAPQYLLKKIELLNEKYDIHVIEYNDYGIFRVQKDRIINLLDNELRTLPHENKSLILEWINEIDPDIIHFEEMPELFNMDDEIAQKIYTENTRYKIFETSHDSAFDPAHKKFFPDKFLFCSDNQLIKFRCIDVPACVIEYDTPLYQRKNREEGLKFLGLDPDYKHILNVGLWTPRKNQAEILEYAKHFTDEKVYFHFIGNQAGNFEDYWKPLLNEVGGNCVVHGERSDLYNFYSCMDLFLFTSKGHHFDMETNPLVLKEAMSWQLPILMYKLPSYLDKFDNKVTYLSEGDHSFEKNLLKISLALGIPDRFIRSFTDIEEINDAGEPGSTGYPKTKITLHSYSYFEAIKEKLVCLYDAGTDLLIYRTNVFGPSIWFMPHANAETLDGLTVRIYDVHHNEFENVTESNNLTHHNLLYEKTYDTIPTDFYKEHRRSVHASNGDQSAWFTMYEIFVKQVYQDLNIKPNDIVVDIGAHVGMFSMYANEKGAKQIYAFEPTPSTFKYTSKNLGRLKNVKTFNYAMSGHNGHIQFIIVGPSTVCSSYTNVNNNEYNEDTNSKKTIDIPCMDFHTFADNNEVDRIDVMKIDCEGGENDIFPTISDDYLKYRIRKLYMEVHNFLPEKEDNINFCLGMVNRLKNLGYEVTTKDIMMQGELGEMYAERMPKIKIVHMLVDVNGQREIESIKHLTKFAEETGWDYEQMVNDAYTELPPKDTCSRPDAVQMEPGEYKLAPAHYGNFLAHRTAIETHLTDDYDAVLFCECDAIFIKPLHDVHREIMDRFDDLMENNLNYMSFGKRIPDWHYDEHKHFGVTDRMSEAHCYLIPTERRNYFVEKFKNSGWDTYDLWLNNTVFPDKLSGITKEPFSIQCSGESYLDKSHKDGTTLLKDGDITYEL